MSGIDFREEYASEIAAAIEAQRERARREEEAREEPMHYVVGFSCAPSVWEDIKTVINAHDTFDRTYRFYPVERRQGALPGMDGKG